MTTCPIEKDQMVSGEWSILVIGNNADGNPFAYERDFNLTVGYVRMCHLLPKTLLIERCQAANNNDHCTNRDIHTILDPRGKRNQ
jgi:hypothetical protein